MKKTKTTKAKGPISTFRLEVKLYRLEDGKSDYRLSRRFSGKSLSWSASYRMASAISIMVGDLYREMVDADSGAILMDGDEVEK